MGTCQFQIIVIVRKILSYPRGLTRKLQGIDRDLAKVMSDVKLLKETLKELRRIVDMQYGSKSLKKMQNVVVQSSLTKWLGMNIIRSLFQFHSWMI